MDNSDLHAWLAEHIRATEKALNARVQMEAAWRGGTPQEWKAAGCTLSKADRIQVADRHARIVTKVQRDLQALRTLSFLISEAQSPRP